MAITEKRWSAYTEHEINKMKSKCKRCPYNNAGTGSTLKNCCDYLLITKHIRDCSISDCTHNKDDKKVVAELKRKNLRSFGVSKSLDDYLDAPVA